MYLKNLFRDQAPLEGREKEGLIILTVVRHLCRLNEVPSASLLSHSPIVCGNAAKLPTAVSQLLICRVGVKRPLQVVSPCPWVWGAALPPLPFPLKTTLMSQLSVLFQMPRAAASHTQLPCSVNSAQLNLSCLKCAVKSR